MASWATKRRWSYISIISIVIIVLIVIPGFFTFYKAPTCFDGIPNQGEQGVDCGGPCQVLCQTAFIPAKVIWADSEMVAPGTYNEAAYIENPNINGAAVDVPYTFSMFDEQGVLISNNSGTVTIPANRNTLAFVGSVKTGTRVPAKNGVTFKFNTPPKWVKAYDTLGDIVIKTPTFHANSDPALGDVGTTLQAPIGNNNLKPYNNVTVFAVLLDNNGNHVGFSKTLIDTIPPGGQVIAPFTWPYSFAGNAVAEEILPVIDPVFSTQ